MEFWLPIVYVAIMGMALLIYVVLDGYDLGVGLLLPAADDREKDILIASIGPFWDANETWIVLGVGVLLIGFPMAHGAILTALYIPVTLMLMGLILRGVAFDLRVKAGDHRKQLWNRAFFLGSLVAAVSQGWMLGAYVTGLRGDLTGHLFAVLIGLTLPAFYLLLGAVWLLIKTEGDLFDKALRWARRSVLPTGLGLLAVSVATPVVSETIAAKWFTLPNLIGLSPIPLSCLVLYAGIVWLLRRDDWLRHGYSWVIFAAIILICLMASLGLAYSIYPYIILDQMTIWEASASVSSLLFALVGIVITLPVILFYTVYVYRVFRGKATDLSYE